MLHESAFIDGFVCKRKRTRYRYFLLERPNLRRKITDRFYHSFSDDLASNVAVAYPRFQYREYKSIEQSLDASERGLQYLEYLEKELRSKGALELCYVISTDTSLDQLTIPLAEGLIAVTSGSGSGTVLSCLPGLLCVFCGEWGSEDILEVK